MPSGKTHDFLTFVTTSGTSYFIWQNISRDLGILGVFILASLFSGLMFGPDLDTRSVQYKRWGPLKFIWLPYQAFGHRSKRTQSHDALFGPFVRIIYFFCVVICVAIFTAGIFSLFNKKLSLDFLFSFFTSILQIPIKYHISLLAGLWLGNIVHYLTDWMWEFVPKQLKH
ncbi:MAG: metal-binding protein [Candidatus Melainabacteria bacterium]|nr:metal-binding protein [Candidatus Melainabacteria bacterium]